MPETSTSVFISYARENQEMAAALAGALERHGISTWWDFKLTGGVDFRAALQRELDRSDAVIVMWSEKSVRSAFVMDEAYEGRRQNKLIPISVDGVGPPWGFGDVHTIDYSGRSIDDVGPLLDAISLVGGGEETLPPARGIHFAALAPTPAKAGGDENLDYVEYYSDVLGLSFSYPSALLTLDTTRFRDGYFELLNLSNETEATLCRTALPRHKDIRKGQQIEKEILERRGSRCTYIGPQKETNWSNWYVLSGFGPDGKMFYLRRWYTERGSVSFEFCFDGARKPFYNHVIEEMTINRLLFD